MNLHANTLAAPDAVMSPGGGLEAAVMQLLALNAAIEAVKAGAGADRQLQDVVQQIAELANRRGSRDDVERVHAKVEGLRRRLALD